MRREATGFASTHCPTRRTESGSWPRGATFAPGPPGVSVARPPAPLDPGGYALTVGSRVFLRERFNRGSVWVYFCRVPNPNSLPVACRSRILIGRPFLCGCQGAEAAQEAIPPGSELLP